MLTRIAYQGIPGSFSYLAARAFFGEEQNWRGTSYFREIFELIRDKHVDSGIIPVENSLAGSVYENYDLLARHDLTVTGEYYLKIEHHLLALPQSGSIAIADQIRDIRQVLSHPKALEQCGEFFRKHPWIEQIAYSDTARAAQFIAAEGNHQTAAIASRQAAELYGLQVLVTNLEDNQQNYTRFLIISKNALEARATNKCSITFTVSHNPGSLFKALEVLAKSNLNLTKLESRPIIGKPFEYVFYVDFEFESGTQASICPILEEFQRHTIELKVLGYYRSALLAHK